MKKVLNIFAALSLFVGLMGCSGSDDVPVGPQTGKLTLQADKTSVIANGTDRVTFQVMMGNQDVTQNENARIYLVERDGKAVNEKQNSAMFGSSVPGSFVFEARYMDDNGTLTSENKITVTVSPNNEKEVFYRKVFAQYFTSIGCHNCPQMNTALKGLDQEYKDRLVIGTFHTDYGGLKDPMTVSVTYKYMVDLIGYTGLPGCYLDLRPEMKCYSLTPAKTTVENIDYLCATYPAACGVKIDSKYDAAKGKINVKFTVKASVSNEYRILPFLVEDGIKASQAGADDSYVHDNVVRVAPAASLVGDRLGTIEKDAEATKSYTFDVQSGWNTDNMRVIVCVLNTSDGTNFFGNNAAVCGINDSIDYLYNE